MIYRSRSYTVFSVCNYTFLALLGLLCILPLVHVFSLSLSDSWAATANVVTFWPIDPTTVAYAEILKNGAFKSALWIGVQRTVLGTAFSMLIILLAGYSLSKNESAFRGRGVYAWYFIFPMLFSGGLIPTYLVVQATGLMNTLAALILPTAVNVWTLILMLNFFRTIPKELEEAAFIDGAGHFTTLFRIFVPISTPAIATLTLFTMVFHWNSWFDGLIYISNSENYPLATFLRSVIIVGDFTQLNMSQNLNAFSERTLKAAQIFIGAVPILIVYPFLQRYFVKGIVLGSVKE